MTTDQMITPERGVVPIATGGNPPDDPELTITASGIPTWMRKMRKANQEAEDIIRCMGDDVSANVRVTAATRLPRRI